ncbi:MAG: DNA-3-methyladenine glycosylase I, partial [Pseudomonadota bacterium]
MRTFDEILDLAGGHHGGAEAVLAKAKNDHAVGDITTVPDDRHLATMTRCVFCAGFNWKVIDTKWAGFEAAFEGFDPHKVAFYGDDALLKLLGDKRLVRNGQKLKATIDNARFVVTIAQGHGSFGRFLKAWPDDSQAEL